MKHYPFWAVRTSMPSYRTWHALKAREQATISLTECKRQESTHLSSSTPEPTIPRCNASPDPAAASQPQIGRRNCATSCVEQSKSDLSNPVLANYKSMGYAT